METRVRKWGNSLALRIPKPLAAQLGLEVDTAVELFLERETLVVALKGTRRYTLNGLLAKVTDRNRHGEVDTGQSRQPSAADL